MYKEVMRIERVRYTNIQFAGEKFYLVNVGSLNHIQAYNLNSLKLEWQSHNEDYACLVVDNMIASFDIQLYNLDGYQVVKKRQNNSFNLVFSNKDSRLLYKTVDDNSNKVAYHLFDTRCLSLIKTDIELVGYPMLFSGEEIVICKKCKSDVINFDILKFCNIVTGECVWQIDLSTIYLDKELNIEEVKMYQDSLIVVTTAGVLRLSPEDGSIIWKTCSYAVTMEIVDNIGYTCSGLSLYKINLDTGEESGYGREYDRLPDFAYNDHMYYPDGYRVVYHDGLLWYSAFSLGHSFLLAINPTDGNYEWIHHVDTYENTEDPQFYGDKMFLWDNGQVLHIYEKEK